MLKNKCKDCNGKGYHERMIKILTTCEIAELHIDIPCFELDKVRWIKVEDVESLIELAYDKYVVPDKLKLNGVNTEHVVIGGVRFKTLVNHPIRAMRAELLEQLEANQKKDLSLNKNVSSIIDN